MMNKLILLAGLPGAGKSYLCDLIIEQDKDVLLLSQDDIKEKLFDEIGFNNLEEKEKVIEQCRKEYYDLIASEMDKQKKLMLDYPFSDKQVGIIDKLSKQYGYEILTIRLVGDLDVIFERRIQRDLRKDRHLAHMVSKYHKGDCLDDHRKADCLITYEGFLQICKERQYAKFQMGQLIEVDVSDFSKVDYPLIVQQVVKFLHE